MRNLKQTELHRLKNRGKKDREKERKTKRIRGWLFSKDCSGVMKMSWRENYDWRQLPDRLGDGRKKKNKSEKMVATELLKLDMETEEERKERLKKMVANHSAEVSP